MMIPRIYNYGQYASDNYGAHTLRVDLGTIDLYYSYDTIVAYRDIDDGLVCSENQWSTTTGKHLNWIQSNHKARVSGSKFQSMLESALARHIQ